jgi:hypothetical protein
VRTAKLLRIGNQPNNLRDTISLALLALYVRGQSPQRKSHSPRVAQIKLKPEWALANEGILTADRDFALGWVAQEEIALTE